MPVQPQVTALISTYIYSIICEHKHTPTPLMGQKGVSSKQTNFTIIYLFIHGCLHGHVPTYTYTHTRTDAHTHQP